VTETEVRAAAGEAAARERLLAAARQLLDGAPEGRAPSVGRIARAAAVSRATVYRYFPTRAALLAAAGRDAPSPAPGASRRAVLEAALDVFAARGIHAATLKEIASRAGLTLSGLHWHFKNKDELMAGVIESLPLLPILLDQAAQAGTADLEGQLTRIARVVLDTMQARPGLVRLLLCEANTYPDVRRLFVEQGAASGLPLLAGIFEEHARRGELRPGPSLVRAQAFLGLLATFAVVRPLPRELVPLDDAEVIREYLQIVVRGVLAAPREGAR
jgi:AcrR family transcriptional regulator